MVGHNLRRIERINTIKKKYRKGDEDKTWILKICEEYGCSKRTAKEYLEVAKI